MNLTSSTTILITGGSAGLGLAVAKQFLNKQCQVHVLARGQEKLEEAKTKHSQDNFFTHQASVTDYASVQKIVESIGTIDVLVNCAGIWLEGFLQDYDPEKIAQVINTNLTGTILATRAVLPGMIKKNSGHIINISSTSGTKPRNQQSVYAASKYGVRGFSDSLSMDLKGKNIRVTGFYPGGMNTGLFSEAGVEKHNQDWMDPQKVAEVIVFIVERGEHMVMNHVVVNKRLTREDNK